MITLCQIWGRHSFLYLTCDYTLPPCILSPFQKKSLIVGYPLFKVTVRDQSYPRFLGNLRFFEPIFVWEGDTENSEIEIPLYMDGVTRLLKYFTLLSQQQID